MKHDEAAKIAAVSIFSANIQKNCGQCATLYKMLILSDEADLRFC